MLQSAAVALRLNVKLEEMFGRIPGQIDDIRAAAEDVRSFLPQNFKGLVFPADPNQVNPEGYIRERSLGELDELRSRLDSSSVRKGSVVQDALQKATTLLQLRLKLQQLGRLGGYMERAFAEVDAVDLGRLKNPQLC